MKRFLTGAFVGFFIIASAMVSQASAADMKIGLVDLMRAINECDAGKRAKADLESIIKSKQTAIEEKGKKIESLKADIDKQAALISPDARKSKEEEIERLIRDYQRMVSDSQAEVKKKEGELTGEILKDLRSAINKIAQEEGYSLVLEKAEGLILYSVKDFEITDKVIKRYDESKAKPVK